MKNFSLSKISLAVTLAYVTLPAQADIQSATKQTQVSRQGGVEIVNIATPSVAGLSHNQYQKFNVDKSGAVLNNAQRAGKSELAGQLNANPNLRQGSATVILNEVVSRNASTIAGKQEIFGQRADYVLANPNGIAVQDGGFINTAKASLVVGKPNVQNGALKGFDVTGEKGLSTRGSMSGKVDQLDLIAPVINIQGNVENAKEINVIGGKNQIERAADGKLTINVQKATGVVLDGQVVGSIQADRIRIHSTDERATLNVTGANLTSKETVISAGNAQFSGKIDSKIENSSRNYTAAKRVKTQESASTRTQTLQKTAVNSENFVVDVANKLTLNATEINAKQAIISGGQTHLGGQITTNSTVSNNNKSKGLWYRNDSNSNSEQTFHRTTLVVDDLTLIANNGALTGEAAKIDAKNALLFTEKGTEFKGSNQRSQQTLESNYRNETAKLKSGRDYVNNELETFVATEFNIAENLRIGGKDEVKFNAVNAKVGGNLLVEGGNKVTFTSQTSQVKRNIDDKEKYWGGIGGSNSGSASVNETVQHGSDINVKGLAYIEANNGVQISGSRVLAGEGYVRAHQGNLTIDSVDAQTTAQTSSRKGTIFNITKARNEAFSSVTTAQGSTLKSDSNLHLLSNNQLDMVGGKIQASGVLDVAAKQVNVKGAQNRSEARQSSYQLGLSKSYDYTPSNTNIEGLVNEVIDTWLDGKKVENPIKLYWDHTAYQHKGTLTLGAQRDSQKITETSYSASQLDGGNVLVNSENLTLVGSQINATQGNVLVDVKTVQTLAQTVTKLAETQTQKAGLTLGGVVNEKGVNSSVTLGGESSKTQTQTQTAQTSQINAANNVILNADKIVHQGSALNAQKGDIIENAQNVHHEAVQTTNFINSQTVKAGITASLQVDKSFKHTYGIEVGADGSHSNSLETRNILTQLTSGGDVVVAGDSVNDVGTQYQADNNVLINAKDYRMQSVVDGRYADNLLAGAKVGVSAQTNGDGSSSVTAKVSVSANYQQDKSASTTVQQANVQGKNVSIVANNLNGQGNILAQDIAYLSAETALNFIQSTETSQQTGGGFNASVSVGGIVKGGAAVPAIDVSVGANGNKGQSQTAVMNTVSGKQVIVNAGGENILQGTHIKAEDAQISGQKVVVIAGESSSKLNAGSAGAGVGIGKGVSGVKAEGKFSVNVEKESVHTASEIDAKNLNIVSTNGIRLDGVQATVENAIVESGKGNLILNALADQTHNTGVSASLALNGDVKDKQWNAKGGSASLDVNVVRNDTYTTSAINANNVNLNVNGNVVLNGSAISANDVNGNVSGHVVSTSATDNIKETSVSLSASGSGKYNAYTTTKLPLALKKDWDNGAIAGIKADANYAVNVTRKRVGVATGVVSPNNQLNVGGQTVVATTVASNNYDYATQGGFTTNLKQRYYLPWRKQQFGQ